MALSSAQEGPSPEETDFPEDSEVSKGRGHILGLLLRPPAFKKPRYARAPGGQLTAGPPTSISAPPVMATEPAPSRLRFSGTRGHSPRQLCRALCLLLAPLSNPPSLSSGLSPLKLGRKRGKRARSPPGWKSWPVTQEVCFLQRSPPQARNHGGLSEGTRQMPPHVMSAGPGLPWTALQVAHCTTPRSTIPKHGYEWCSRPRGVEVLGTPLLELPSPSTTALGLNK